MRLHSRILRLLLLGGLLSGIAGWLLWQRWLPQWYGAVVIAGLQQPVEILRDAYAIPHIYAQTETDAYMALGYAHAQDRLWQMELQRRLGAGTLAEIVGAEAVELDRFSRTMGIRRNAVANLQQLDARTQQILAAYTHGINAYLAEGRLLPPEFLVLRCAPAAWTPEDALGWLKMMAWDLSGNWWQELRNVRLQRRLSPQQRQELLPPYPGEAPLVLPDLTTLYAGLEVPTTVFFRRLPAIAQSAVGSNNWVVDGSRTHSGKPLLANDTHLRLAAPSLWYLAHLHTPEMNVIGATLPGIPAVILGRNDRVAWAFTNTGSDTQDLFVEKIAPHDPAYYLTPQGWRAFETVREIIKVKGQADIEWTVRRSRHGPIISDVGTTMRTNLPGQSALALNWVALRPDDLSLQFPLKVATARNAAELLQAARDFHAPQQNIVYADVDGQIGFVAAGRVPIRHADNDARGLVPVPGWKAQYDWQGWIPFDELPQITATTTGRIVTANHKITPPGYRHWLAADWEWPYRAERIEALLDATSHHSMASFMAIQHDVYNPVAATLLPLMLRITPENAMEQAALERLRQWDMAMTRESPEALLFVEWLRQLTPLLTRASLGELSDEIGAYQPAFLASVLRQARTPWCQESEPPCAAPLRQALRLALERLTQRYGADMRRWAWGNAHSAIATHQPFGEVPLLAWLFNIRTVKAGAYDTIDVSSYTYDAASGEYHSRFGPNYRAVYDLAEPENSLFLSHTGQSGQPLSRHYRSMVRAWQEGRYIAMRTDYASVSRQAAGRLRLQPR